MNARSEVYGQTVHMPVCCLSIRTKVSCTGPYNQSISTGIFLYFYCKCFKFPSFSHILEYSPSNGTLLFGNNIKSKMGILNLIRKIYFNQKTLTKNIFLKFVYVFINAGIGLNFGILNVLCQITFPSCTLSDMDQ